MNSLHVYDFYHFHYIFTYSLYINKRDSLAQFLQLRFFKQSIIIDETVLSDMIKRTFLYIFMLGMIIYTIVSL